MAGVPAGPSLGAVGGRLRLATGGPLRPAPGRRPHPPPLLYHREIPSGTICFLSDALRIRYSMSSYPEEPDA